MIFQLTSLRRKPVTNNDKGNQEKTNKAGKDGAITKKSDDKQGKKDFGGDSISGTKGAEDENVELKEENKALKDKNEKLMSRSAELETENIELKAKETKEEAKEKDYVTGEDAIKLIAERDRIAAGKVAEKKDTE